MDLHKENVAALSAKVKAFHDRGEKFRIYHGSTVRMFIRKTMLLIEVIVRVILTGASEYDSVNYEAERQYH